MQSVSSRIWTRVAVSPSYDDNDYTTGTSETELINKYFDIVWEMKKLRNMKVVVIPIAAWVLRQVLKGLKKDWRNRK